MWPVLRAVREGNHVIFLEKQLLYKLSELTAEHLLPLFIHFGSNAHQLKQWSALLSHHERAPHILPVSLGSLLLLRRNPFYECQLSSKNMHAKYFNWIIKLVWSKFIRHTYMVVSSLARLTK